MWVTTLTVLNTEVFVSHANAPLTPVGRLRLAVLIIDQGWSIRRAAERFQVSRRTTCCSPSTRTASSSRSQTISGPVSH